MSLIIYDSTMYMNKWNTISCMKRKWIHYKFVTYIWNSFILFHCKRQGVSYDKHLDAPLTSLRFVLVSFLGISMTFQKTDREISIHTSQNLRSKIGPLRKRINIWIVRIWFISLFWIHLCREKNEYCYSKSNIHNKVK